MTASSATVWAAALARLAGLPGGRLNIAYEAVDRHVLAGNGDQTALIWFGREGHRQMISYAALAAEAVRFAHVLRAHGVWPGERMFLLCGRVRELYAATIGELMAEVVVSPLFAEFGPEPVRARMEMGGGLGAGQHRAALSRKGAQRRESMPGLRLVLILGDGAPEGCVALSPAVAAAPDRFDTHPTRPEDMALLHFTSGITGPPKGVVHVHGAAVAHVETGRLALDLRPCDIYCCTADPG